MMPLFKNVRFKVKSLFTVVFAVADASVPGKNRAVFIIVQDPILKTPVRVTL